MCAWLLILCAFCSLGATSAQAVDVTGLGKIAVASGAADWGIGALQQALDAQMSAVYNVSRAVVVGMGAAEMLDATNNFIDSRPETQYAAGRITLPDLVSTWLNEYAREKSIQDLGQIYEQLQTGITVDSNGVMYYNSQACQFMDDFCGWAWISGPRLVDYADTVTGPGDLVNGSGVRAASYPSGAFPDGNPTIGSGTYTDQYTHETYSVEIRSGPWAAAGTTIYVTQYGGDLYTACNPQTTNLSVQFFKASEPNSGFKFADSARGTSNFVKRRNTSNVYNVSWSVPVSTADPAGVSIFDLEQGSSDPVPVGNPDLFGGLSSLSIDPSDFVSVQQPEGDGWKVSPSEWLRVVTDVVSGNDQTTMTVTQDDTGVTQHVVVRPSDLPSVPGDPVQPAPEINPTVPDTTVPTFDLPDISGDWNGTSSYEVNIRDLFPFCIPFDVLDICKLFAAEPVAPAFEIPIKSEAYGIDETVEFDLSPFDGVASTVRTLEKVAFLVGLALVTKNLLGG